MAYDPGALNSTLAAVAGDDPMLAAELRTVFVDSAVLGLGALQVAHDPDGWTGAAQRMKGLAASFGAVRLMALAEQALTGPPGDAAVLRRMDRVIAGF